MSIETQKSEKLPINWRNVRLKEISKRIHYGYTSKSSINEIGPKYLRITDIDGYRVNWEEVPHCKIEEERKEKYLLNSGDLVFARTGSIGKSFLLKDPIPEAVFASYLIRVILNGKVNNNYIYYFFQSPMYWNQIMEQKTGIVQPNVNAQKLSELVIPLPPSSVQEIIVSKLDELFSQFDTGLASLQRTKLLLNQYRQAVLKAAMTGELTKEWREKHQHELEPASVLLERISLERRQKWEEEQLAKFQEKGRISKDDSWKKKYKEPENLTTTTPHKLPENWLWCSISQITTLMRNGIYKSREFYSNDGFACLRMYNIQDGKIIWKNIKRMTLSQEEIDNYILEPGDILVNRVNSKELVGKSALIPEDLERCIYESKNIRIRINKHFSSSFTNYWLLIYRQAYFYQHFQQTVGMASVNQEQLGAMPVPLPPKKEILEITNLLELHLSVYDYLNNEISQNQQKLEILRQSILKSAFEGKLIQNNSPKDNISKHTNTEEGETKTIKSTQTTLNGWKEHE